MARVRFALLGILALLAAAAPASAHDRVCVEADGTAMDHEHQNCGADAAYQFLIGWQSEPAISGQVNGPWIKVTRPSDNGSLVTNASGMRAQFEYGGRVLPLDLSPKFGEPGVYVATMIPTREGIYTLRFSGDVEGVPLNFTKAPEEVTAASEIQFPEEEASAAALEERVGTLENRVAQLESRPSSSSVTTTPGDGKGAPGFEPLMALAAVGVALAVAARRRGQP